MTGEFEYEFDSTDISALSDDELDDLFGGSAAPSGVLCLTSCL
ncbi:hypothetical protein [Streptacidiphilus sp. PB12-B1b]|nr:hypothetical protein [Streptacidiphilus sp. PB12-B1b]